MKPEARHIGYITMRDGAELAYVAYVPPYDVPVPAILTMDAYGISGIEPATAEQADVAPTRLMESGLDPQTAHVRQFLDAGYAFVGVNVRGTGASTGKFAWLNPMDGKDGVQIIEWIETQEWCDGNVGMCGASHQAVTQLAVAAERPPNLKAIAPASALLDTYRDVFCPGGLPNVAFAHKWFNVYQPMLADLGVAQRVALGDDRAGQRRAAIPPPIVAQLLEHPDRDDWWEQYSLEASARRINIPALVIHAWQDPAVPSSSAVRLFHALGGPKRLIGSNGGHDISVHMLDELLRWFDRWLRPSRLGNHSPDESAVSVWMEAAPDAQGWVRPRWAIDLDSWPEPAATVTYTLTPEGALAESPDNAEAGTRSYLYPIGSQLIGDDASFALPPDSAGSLTYRTAPLDQDVFLLGAPRLTLNVSSELHDVHLLLGLHDVDPDGVIHFVQQGVHRGSAPVSDSDQASAGLVDHDFTRRVDLGDGKVHELEISLFPVAHLFREGHIIELVVMSPSAVPGPEWGFAPFPGSGLHTIHHGPATRSMLALPVVTSIPPHPDRPERKSFPSQPTRPGPR